MLNLDFELWQWALILAAMLAVVVLEIYLCTREKSWPGVVLPVLLFLATVPLLVSTVDFNAGSLRDLAGPLLNWLFFNIPTATTVIMYVTIRRRIEADRAAEARARREAEYRRQQEAEKRKK